MAKQSGLGDTLLVNGVDLSGDVGAMSAIQGQLATLEATGLNVSAKERIAGHHSGAMNFMSFFNDDVAGAHTILKAQGASDIYLMYLRGSNLGGAAAAMRGPQVDYGLSRGADASLTAAIQAQSNVNPLEWLEQLTAGKATHASATNGSSVDLGAVSTLFGLSAWLQVVSLGSGTPTVKLQDSADNSTFADITGGSFGVVTAPSYSRLQTGVTATIRRYVRVATTGTFSNLVLAVGFNRYLSAAPS